MKKRTIWVSILPALVPALLLWYCSAEAHAATPDSREVTSSSSIAAPGKPVGHELPQRAEPPADKRSALRGIFSNPLSLHGKVLDQNGAPVPGAIVKVRVADKPLSDGSSAQRTTDLGGSFEVTDVKGAGIYAEAAKDGYYSGDESRRMLQSGEMPTKDAPLVLRLFKKGNAQDLIRYTFASRDLVLDGTPIEYDFAEKKFSGVGQGQLRVQVWVEGSMQKHFSWRYRISLPSGGFVRRETEFDFVAPPGGFAETLNGSINATDKTWSGSFNGDYFIRLPDGKFGRIKFSLSRGRDSFNFRIEQAAINPSGDRNLE